jgi:hypothetical protein
MRSFTRATGHGDALARIESRERNDPFVPLDNVPQHSMKSITEFSGACLGTNDVVRTRTD